MPDSIIRPALVLEPGAHVGVEMDDYTRADLCGPGTHAVSGSGLWMIDNESLAHYHARYVLGIDEGTTDAMSFGTLAHCLLLEGPHMFAERYAVKPAGHDGRTKVGKEWLAENAAKEHITEDEFARARAMVNAIQEHPLARNAFEKGRPEVTLIWRDAATGLYLKARPDWLPFDGPGCPNYKTAASAKPDDFARSAFNYGYHASAALCADALREVCGWSSPVPYFVVQERRAPHVTTLCLMKDDALAYGARIVRRSLDRLARALDSGAWPGYASEVTYIDMPAWTARTAELREAAGEFQAP